MFSTYSARFAYVDTICRNGRLILACSKSERVYITKIGPLLLGRPDERPPGIPVVIGRTGSY